MTETYSRDTVLTQHVVNPPSIISKEPKGLQQPSRWAPFFKQAALLQLQHATDSALRWEYLSKEQILQHLMPSDGGFL